MKALVAYTSKRGSTAEIAEAVAKRLREADFEVDCRKSGEVPDVGHGGPLLSVCTEEPPGCPPSNDLGE